MHIYKYWENRRNSRTSIRISRKVMVNTAEHVTKLKPEQMYIRISSPKQIRTAMYWDPVYGVVFNAHFGNTWSLENSFEILIDNCIQKTWLTLQAGLSKRSPSIYRRPHPQKELKHSRWQPILLATFPRLRQPEWIKYLYPVGSFAWGEPHKRKTSTARWATL